MNEYVVRGDSLRAISTPSGILAILQGDVIDEAGKGDHRHIGESEKAYRFVDLDQLMADFERDIARWQDENRNA